MSAPALDPSNFDTTVSPREDLFRHINGTWLATASIDDDKSGAGAFIDLRDQAEVAVREIITGLVERDDLTDPDERRIAALYRSFMDVDRIEEMDAAPLQPFLAEIDAIDSVTALAQHLGARGAMGLRSALGWSVEADPGDPTRPVLFLGQGGLGLPDEAYYRAEEHAETLTSYREHVARTFTLAGFGDAEARADRVLTLETAIASHHWDNVTTRDLVKMYNLQTLESFTAAVPGLLFDEILVGAGIAAEKFSEFVNCQPSFFTGLAELLVEERLEQWRDWARFATISGLSPYLSQRFVDARFAFYGTTLSGTPTNRERWKRGVGLVEGALGEAVGRLYVQHHFTPESKARMDELVANVIEAYRLSITELDWMTDATRAEALRKLEGFTPKIGHPVKWRDYSGFEPGDDVVANVLASNRLDAEYELGKLGRPIDRDEWEMTPQTVNAYYHPLRNEIVFPAAILQPPFFNADADDAINYGGIGAVIAHEIGHGFDDKGSTCDGDGRLRDWWTAEDREAFEDRTKALIDQFAVLSPAGADGQKVNGELTIGENIGDLGGLGIAYKAWRLAVGDSEPEPIDGLTGSQRLFFGWAQVWRGKRRPETVKMLLAVDPHSPEEFRCNQIARNIDAFADAFGVEPGDGMWLAPEERVTIW